MNHFVVEQSIFRCIAFTGLLKFSVGFKSFEFPGHWSMFVFISSVAFFTFLEVWHGQGHDGKFHYHLGSSFPQLKQLRCAFNRNKASRPCRGKTSPKHLSQGSSAVCWWCPVLRGSARLLCITVFLCPWTRKWVFSVNITFLQSSLVHFLYFLAYCSWVFIILVVRRCFFLSVFLQFFPCLEVCTTLLKNHSLYHWLLSLFVSPCLFYLDK